MKTPYQINQGEMTTQPENEVWVTAQSSVHRVAERIVRHVMVQDPVHDGYTVSDEHDFLDLACIGPQAINQAMKAVAVARETLAEDKLDLAVKPFFSTIIDASDRERTRMVLRVILEQLDD